MYALSYGLFVVTARVGQKDNGCITNTVAQVTTQPNRITLAVNRSNYTCDMIRESGCGECKVRPVQALRISERAGHG